MKKIRISKAISLIGRKLLIISIIFVSNGLYAAVITFTGATSSNWGTTTNWSSNTLPTSDDIAYINGNKLVTISSETTVTIQKISFGSGASLINNGTLYLTPTTNVITSGALFFAGNNSFTNNATLTANNASQTGNYNVMTFAGTGNTIIFNGTNNLAAKPSTSLFAANASSSTTIGGSGFTVGNASTGATYSIFSTIGASSDIIIDSGTTINLYIGTGNGFYMVNSSSITNNGTITATVAGSVAGRALNIWQGADVSATLTNNGTFNMIGFDAPTVMGGSTGYGTINNSGTLNIQNNNSTSYLGLNLASSNLPNVFTNTGTLKIQSNSTAINLPATTYGGSFTNTGTITITKGNIYSGASVGSFPTINNNSGGVFNFNYGVSTGGTQATSNVIVNNNIGATINGSCTFPANTLVTSAGSTLSPGDYNTSTNTSGIGIMFLTRPAAGTKFPLLGNLKLQVNGKTSAGTLFDQLQCTEIDVTGATLNATVGYLAAVNDFVGVVYAATSKAGPFAASIGLPSGWVVDNTTSPTAIAIKCTVANGTIYSSTSASAFGLSASTGSSDISVSGTGTFLTIDVPITVNSLTITPGACVTLNSGQTLTAGTFTLQSDASGTGTYVDKNTAASPPTLSANAEQYLPQGRNWYVGSPITAGNASILTVTGLASSVSHYYEKNGWVNSYTGTLEAGKGYIAVSNSGSGLNKALFSGTLTNGNVPITLRREGSTKAGFSLIANPYPSYLNAMTAINLNSSVEATIWYRTRSVGGSYYFETVNTSSGVGTNAAGTGKVTGYIPPMQAFWVRTLVDNQEITFTNAMRTHANPVVDEITVNTTPLKAPALSNQTVRLQVSNAANMDEAVIYFNSNALDGYDRYDSHKWMNDQKAIPNIYSIVGSENLVINGMNSLPLNTDILIGYSTELNDSLSISANEISNIGEDVKLILKDKHNLLTPEFDLTNGAVYKFKPEIGTTNNRISVIFKSSSVISNLSKPITESFSIYQNGSGQLQLNYNEALNENCSVSVYNAVGQKLITKRLNQNSTLLDINTTQGVYIISILNGDNKISKKFVVN